MKILLPYYQENVSTDSGLLLSVMRRRRIFSA